MIRVLIAFIASTFLNACSIVKISSPGGVTTIERDFGFVSIHLSPQDEAVVAQIRSFGYVRSPLSMSLGYSDQSIAAFPESCHLVLWMESREQFQEILSLLADVDNICPTFINQEGVP